MDVQQEVRELDFLDALDQIRACAYLLDDVEQVRALRTHADRALQLHQEAVRAHKQQIAKFQDRSATERDSQVQKIAAIEEQLEKRLSMIEAEKDTCADLRAENIRLRGLDAEDS